MVRYFIIIILFLFGFNRANCQNDTILKELGFVVEVMPEYSEDDKGLTQFINYNLIYPEQAKKDSIEGIVFLTLWVDTLGNTNEHKVLKGVRNDLDEEALRVARLIKFEKPAMKRGKPVAVRYNLPIEFKLPIKAIE
nr:energy transducer TonB [Bacteroidota bacterium]